MSGAANAWGAALAENGRTYYYHKETRETTWQMPAEFEAEMAAAAAASLDASLDAEIQSELDADILASLSIGTEMPELPDPSAVDAFGSSALEAAATSSETLTAADAAGAVLQAVQAAQPPAPLSNEALSAPTVEKPVVVSSSTPLRSASLESGTSSAVPARQVQTTSMSTTSGPAQVEFIPRIGVPQANSSWGPESSDPLSGSSSPNTIESNTAATHAKLRARNRLNSSSSEALLSTSSSSFFAAPPQDGALTAGAVIPAPIDTPPSKRKERSNIISGLLKSKAGRKSTKNLSLVDDIVLPPPPEDPPIPLNFHLVSWLVEHVERVGLSEEGIYRLSGSALDVKATVDSFRVGLGILDLNELDIHVVTGSLKTYLRQLDPPLVPLSVFDDFSALNDNDAQFQKAIDKLPKLHLHVLHTLIRHINKLSEHRSVNKMSIDNLAVAFAPCFLNSRVLVVDAASANRDAEEKKMVLHTLIHHLDGFPPIPVDDVSILPVLGQSMDSPYESMQDREMLRTIEEQDRRIAELTHENAQLATELQKCRDELDRYRTALG